MSAPVAQAAEQKRPQSHGDPDLLTGKIVGHRWADLDERMRIELFFGLGDSALLHRKYDER